MIVKNGEKVAIVYIPKERHLDPEVVEAKRTEVKHWMDFEAVDEIEDKGQKHLNREFRIHNYAQDGDPWRPVNEYGRTVPRIFWIQKQH